MSFDIPRVGRVAALCDIHGNLPALDAALAQIEPEGVGLIVIGGDIASGPMPVQTIDRLLAAGDHVRFLRGNADRELVERYDDRSSFIDSDEDIGLHAIGGRRAACHRRTDRF